MLATLANSQLNFLEIHSSGWARESLIRYLLSGDQDELVFNIPVENNVPGSLGIIRVTTYSQLLFRSREKYSKNNWNLKFWPERWWKWRQCLIFVHPTNFDSLVLERLSWHIRSNRKKARCLTNENVFHIILWHASIYEYQSPPSITGNQDLSRLFANDKIVFPYL